MIRHVNDGPVSAEGDQFPPTYLVIRFTKNLNDMTSAWLVEKITGRKIDGGAELLVRRQPYDKKQGLVLHVSASKMKFLQMAEEYELFKTDCLGVQREFLTSQLEDFVFDGMRVDDLLTTTERQTLVRHEIDNLRALASDKCLPGYSNISLYEGKSILQTMMDTGLITQMYPLHDQDILKKLGHGWFMSFTKQPMGIKSFWILVVMEWREIIVINKQFLEMFTAEMTKTRNEDNFHEIKSYFGEAIALYFIFVGYYSTALLVPALLGVIQMFLSTETLTYYCVFNVLWVIVFLEMWKRKSNELAFTWGTIGMTSLDEPRANFRGKLGIDPITGKLQPQAPRWKTYAKMYCVSFPIVIVCLVGGFVMMLWSFWAEEQLKEVFGADSWWVMVPSVVYTVLVYVLNLFYRQFATFLTNWENHRTQSQYDRHRVIKMVLFEFVNNFLALFYIAFILQDIEMLKQQLATMLIILQAINHIQEALLPLLIQLLTVKMTQWFQGGYKKLDNEDEDDTLSDIPLTSRVPCLRADDSRVEQADRESLLDDYQGTYDDYLELFIQFGYVILFSSVYPLAALFAVLNNVLEIRADAFKLCRTCQRPPSYRVKNIGAWQRAFEIIGAMSIMTNCGLLWLSPRMRRASEALGLSALQHGLCFVVLEHALLGVRYVLHQAVSERPEWVRVALARKSHVAKEALKKDRARKSSKLFRHYSVYGTNEAL